MPALPPAINGEAATQWRTFEQALKAGDLTLTDAPAIATDALRAGFAFSQFISRQCIRRPALAAGLIRSGDLERKYGPEDWQHQFQRQMHKMDPVEAGPESTSLPPSLSETQFQKRLRIYRHREMVRIAVRDLAGLAGLAETLADLTALAEQCLEQALEFLHDRLCREWGRPLDGDGNPQRLVILGMGKLGAGELNFSSDVDLIFAYPSEGHTVGAIRSTSSEDFCVRLCRKLIQTIGANTAEGFVFRVDTRLRPFGDAGALALSFDRMLDYYQTYGREWERYALIKARVVAGDKPAGRKLLDDLSSFVYRRYLDYNAFESLRDMKQRISTEVTVKGMQNNIKLGPGGIREIEFFGQMFQLLRGGVQPELRARSILTILKRLANRRIIPALTEEDLRKAYIFLRRAENRIQAYADQQRHDLPSSQEGQRHLAAAMGFGSRRDFEHQLNRHRRKVQHHFDALLKTGEDESAPAQDPLLAELDRAWQPNVVPEEAHGILERAGFSDPPKARQMIRDLQDDRAIGAMSPVGADRLNKIMPALLRESGGADRPQLVLSRLLDLIKSICRRTSYLALLCEYPSTLNILVRLFASSPWIASLLSRHPVLLDELLDPRTLYHPPRRAELVNELRTRLSNIAQDDLEEQMEALRIFKQINQLRIAASDITSVLPLMKVSDHLTDLAEVVVAEVVRLGWHHLASKHGVPVCRLDGRVREKGFAVIAYGKLGGRELGYGSDLDLVFMHAAAPGTTRGGPRPIDNALFFARLGQRVLHLLTAHTASGILYEADMRLRPSGDSGMLVSHIDGFRAYQHDQAWTWEHQALIRARAICGDQLLREKFERIRLEILYLPREESNLRTEVVTMRERLRQTQAACPQGRFDIKQGPGGIVDIEFLVQFLLLRHAHRHPDIARWTDNVRQLQELARCGLIDADMAFGLRRASLILRAVCHRLNLKGLPTQTAGHRFVRVRNFVRRYWVQFLKPQK